MTTGTKEAVVAASDEVADLVRGLPPHLRENFEKSDRQLRDLYGDSPGVAALVRLWLACGTASQIRREFELAVLDIKQGSVEPDANGDFDENDL